jgi:hypothetical protein
MLACIVNIHSDQHSKLSRREIRRIFKAHRGAQAQLARQLEIGSSAITNWIKRTSKSETLDAAVPEFAAKVASGEIIIPKREGRK